MTCPLPRSHTDKTILLVRLGERYVPIAESAVVLLPEEREEGEEREGSDSERRRRGGEDREGSDSERRRRGGEDKEGSDSERVGEREDRVRGQAETGSRREGSR